MTAAAPPKVLLGHGASGTAASMRPHVAGLETRGIDAEALELPRSSAERAAEVFVAAMARVRGPVVIGGHSFGGRAASMVAAGPEGRGVAGLVLLSYPLHRPGHPDELRVDHWPAIGCPVLLLSGEADPFARVDLLRTAVGRLPHHELHTYPRIRHGVTPVLDDALNRIAEFVRSLRRR